MTKVLPNAVGEIGIGRYFFEDLKKELSYIASLYADFQKWFKWRNSVDERLGLFVQCATPIWIRVAGSPRRGILNSKFIGSETLTPRGINNS